MPVVPWWSSIIKIKIYHHRETNLDNLTNLFHPVRAMTDPVTRKGLLLKADPIAAAFRDEVKQSLEQCRVRPKLVGILATSSAPSKNYAEFTKKQCEELGVEFVLIKIGAAVSPDLSEGYGVEQAIIEANEDDSVHGIMVSCSFFCASPWFSLNALLFQGLFPNFWSTAGWYFQARLSYGLPVTFLGPIFATGMSSKRPTEFMLTSLLIR